MRVRVTHLGPLVEGELDLSAPLMVLMGLNGSGKTWLTWVLYTLSVVSPRLLEEALAPQVRPHLRDGVLHLQGAALASFWAVARASLGPAVCQTLPTVFGLADEHFAQCTVECLAAEPHRIAAVTTRDGFLYAFDEDGLYLGPSDLPDRPQGVLSEARAIELAAVVAAYALRPQVLAMPAERAGLLVLSRPLARAMFSGTKRLPERVVIAAPDGPHVQMVSPREADPLEGLPLPLRGFLEASAAADMRTPPSGAEAQMDRVLLKGTVRFDEDRGARFAPDASGALPVTLPQAPSGVKALALLGRLLRESEARGAWLMLDEPEINLHPSLQVVLSRMLVEAIHRGARLLVSTHSDYILRELSHCVMAAHPAALSVREAYGYTATTSLAPTALRVLSVEEGRLRAVPVGPYGFDTAAINAVVAQQAEAGQTLAGAIDWAGFPQGHAAEG